MKFIETKLDGAYLIEPERLEDERGFFARSFCQNEFEAHGLNPRVVQCNISYNKREGTLRGMHYQVAPMAEAKLVRCTRGAIYDVIIDLRPESPTYCQWAPVELTADNRCMLYIPEGFAHGFQTLEDDTEVFYQMSEFYHPECVRGVRWDDKAFGIEWPLSDVTISIRDQSFPSFVHLGLSGSFSDTLVISSDATISKLASIENSVRGSKIVIHDGVVIDAFVKIKPVGGGGDILIGENTYVNSGTVIYSGNGVKIGKNVLIASNCTLAPVNHEYRSKDMTIREQRFMPSKGGIIIEDDVWIGANTVILDGVVIRNGVVVGAGSVVRDQELMPYGVYAGNPLKLIKMRV